MFLIIFTPRTGNVCVSSRRYVAPGESYHGRISLVAWTTLPAMTTADLVESFGGHAATLLALSLRERFFFTKFSLPEERRWGTFWRRHLSLRY